MIKEKDRRDIKRRSVRSFSVFILVGAAMILGWFWLRSQARENGIQRPVRRVLNANEEVFSGILSDQHLAKTFPKAQAAKKARVNGSIGLKGEFDAKSWRLHVVKLNGDTLNFSLKDIQKLPKIEYTFNFKCIEGWSQISNWGGARFSDFVKAYHLQDEMQMAYVGLKTPDGKYYVGMDMASALHPQTLLCYELNGQALPMEHGYPLRLMIPVKYGVKSLKRIGTIFFSNTRPPDYWAERGYDYFIGL